MHKKLLLLLPLFLFACEHPGPPAPEPSFTRYQPIYLHVASIDVVDEYESPMAAPNVEHLIPYSPSDAMHIWVKDRLRAVGSEKSLQVIIKDASVISTPIAQDNPFADRANRYDAKLNVEMRIYGASGGLSEANINVTATQSITINAKASLAERKAIFNKMIFNLMESMNAELEKNIFQYFGNTISYSHGM